MILNLDSHFKPIEGKEINFESFVFNGGEPHIRIKEFKNKESVHITHRINSFNDLGLLCIAVDALKRMHVKNIHAFIPYFPAARQDRVMVKGESLSLKVYTEIVNALKLESVTIFDPHSDVTPALLNNCITIPNTAFIEKILSHIPSDLILISPDAGASKKIFKLANQLGISNIMECGKKRNIETGQLTGFSVPVQDVKNKPCLIVDDICDGGGTFLGLASELKKKNCGELFLAVSHGIFSNGYDELSTSFKQIFTTDSVNKIESPQITQIPLNTILKKRIMINPLLLTDGYKVDHRRQYPANTTLVYSNWTPRKSRLDGIDNVVFFGLQYFIKKYIMEEFENNFFSKPKTEVLKAYSKIINNYLGENSVGIDHIGALHDIGYIPMVFKALPEGVSVPMRVPMFTMYNTLPQFFWLTNYFETILSTTVWLPCNSATIARQYRKILDKYANETSSIPEFVDWQGHDFSMRGMAGLEAALISGSGHLLSFTGTDTIPAIDFLEKYYNANSDEELVGGSVAATEHSVMSMGTTSGEEETFKRLITEVYPKGIVSVVSDTWDLWKVLTEYIPKLKEEILNRDGKLVIRPDSGDPVKIICGDPNSNDVNVKKGVVQLLWDTFGGTINDKGFKELDGHIGAIYGDSITLDRAKQICENLKQNGFASTNVVLGVGSFTYQYNTRDTFGFAMKATYGEVNGEGREIYKDPITDDGTKKSARGLIKIIKESGTYKMLDQVSWAEEAEGELKEVYKDGILLIDEKLSDIRKRVKKAL